VSRPLRRGRKA